MNRKMQGLSFTSKLLVAVVVIASTGLFSVEASSRVLAQCNPGRTNNGSPYFDGWEAYEPSGQQVGGIQSSILTYQPYVAVANTSASWISLYNPTNDNNGNSGENWAQVGWLAVSSSVIDTFEQYTTHAWVPADGTTYLVSWVNNITPIYQGSRYTYGVLYNNTPGDFTMQINGNNFVNPSSASFTPDAAENFGEIKTYASQMAGGNSYPEDYSGTKWWLPNTNPNWTPYYPYATGGTIPSGSPFNYHNFNSTESQISDQACSS